VPPGRALIAECVRFALHVARLSRDQRLRRFPELAPTGAILHRIAVRRSTQFSASLSNAAKAVFQAGLYLEGMASTITAVHRRLETLFGAGPTRRDTLAAAFIAAMPLALLDVAARAGQIDPADTAITPIDAIKWSPWSGGPQHSGEMATLYGGLDRPGPYLVLMKWHPGYMSAPHSYATDRLSLVLSGTWWVNSGADFDPDNAVPVSAGGFVRRIARTPHYDGVKREAKDPAVIALFGIAPVKFELSDPGGPTWRQI